MDGHEHHLIGALVIAVDIADEGDIFQIAFQRGFLTVLVAVVLDVIHQLTKVLQAVSRILVALGCIGFQHGLIAGQLDHIGCKLVQRAGLQRILQALIDLPELEQRHYGAAELCILVGMADDVQHAHALLRGQIGNDLHGGGTDLAGRLVDDAAQAHIIAGVRHDGHVGMDILDLFAVVEALAAHDLVGDACTGKVAFDGGRLGVHAVEDGVVGQMSALFQVLADHIRDVAGLVLLVLGGVHLHLIALPIAGPQGLALALGVMLNDTVRSVQDIGRRAVVLFQTDGLGARVNALEIKDVLNGSAAEAVDALVIIAHHADVLFRAGEEAHQTELRHTGVLILVHQQIAVFVLVEIPHILVLGQQLHSLVDQVVKVECSGFLQALFVGRVDAGRQRAFGIFCGAGKGLFRADKLILPSAHLVDRSLDGQELIVHIQVFVDSLHHALGIIGIVDSKAARVADLLRPAAQDAYTGRVEGGSKHFVALFTAQHPAQTFLQLPCCLVGKGNGHHVPAAHSVLAQHPVQPAGGGSAGHDGVAQSLDIVLRGRARCLFGAVGRAEPDEVCNAVYQHGGLAAACTSKDEQRAIGGEHCLPLHIVQAAKLFFDIGIAQSAEFLCEICCHGFPCSFYVYTIKIQYTTFQND